MKILKRILLALAVLFLLIQFIRPTRNALPGLSPDDIGAKFTTSQEVRDILRTSCYDCHSNTTQYPWYAELQPVGWWLASHIEEARRELNFSEFSGYRLRRQFIKLQQIADEVNEGAMPLPSYLLLHADAKLSPEQKQVLTSWISATRDSMKAVYPADSLVRNQ